MLVREDMCVSASPVDREECVSLPRVPASTIDVTIAEAEETPLRELLEQGCDEEILALKNGTRASADACVKSLVWDDVAARVKALCAFDFDLGADKCIVTDGVNLITGKMAVWRYPCHSPRDMCVLEGVEPPSDYSGPLPRTSILLSRKGLLNTAMAGGGSSGSSQLIDGDIDGDDNELTKQKKLVEFLELFQPYVDAYKWEALSVKALTGLNPYETEWPICADRCLLSGLEGASFVEFCAQQVTRSVKGIVANMSGRATAIALESKNDKDLEVALIFTVLAHAVMDAHKRYRCEDFIDNAKYFIKALRVKEKVQAEQMFCGFNVGGVIKAEEEAEKLLATLESLTANLPADEGSSPVLLDPTLGRRADGIIVPTQVNYVGKGGNLYETGYEFHGSALVVSKLLGATYLWDKVRVSGGAYGGLCRFDPRSGDFKYLSYRDPNLGKTLEAYDGAPAFLKDLDLGEDELTKAIIGCMGDIDAYLLPDAKGYQSMLRYLLEEDDTYRQRVRDEILGTKVEDFRSFAASLEPVVEKGGICVVGSAEVQFGSYGSIWSVFALADSRRWKQPNGEPACLASSGCGLTVRLARLLAEVDQWLQETRERRAAEIRALAQLDWPAAEGPYGDLLSPDV
ncbi:PREP1 [Symbiodinium sp. CCMP2592]|nr:PREP1 [Symbiodinium sp. CCMP2592]